MNPMQSLSDRFYRATTTEERIAITNETMAMMDAPDCWACGETKEDGFCWNIDCPEGRDNIDGATDGYSIGDAQYHAAIDRDLEVYP